MLATAIIVFRETLEAALIVGIVLAACRGVSSRGLWAGLGLAGGLLGSVAVALFANVITQAAEGMGQELLNAAILFTAAGMLAWHAIWMSSHGRELARHVGSVGREVAAGERSLAALALVIGAAVLREGSETVLFLNGVASSGESSASELVAGGVLGAAAGAASGAMLYLGLVRIPVRHFFTVTNVLLVALMAGMAAQGVGFLVQAGYLAPLVDPVWDTTWALSERSLPGKVLHTLIGYESRPTGVQLLVYVGMIAAVVAATRWAASRHKTRALSNAVAATVALATLTAAALIALPGNAEAGEFYMRYPNKEAREVEIEQHFATTFDKREEKNHVSSSVTEIGVGVLPFWFTEFEIETAKKPGENWATEALAWGNYFVLTEKGKYFLDASIYAKYEWAQKRDDADAVVLGILMQKELGNTLHTANILWEKQVGPLASNADTMLYSWQSRYRLHPMFQPGFELFGEIEDLSKPGRFNEQQFRIGPMFAGAIGLSEYGGKGKIKYEAGYLFGATTETEHGTLRAKLEYEFAF